MWQLLTDRPKDAAWLKPDQRAWLIERMDSERAQREAIRKYSLAEVFSNPKMLLLTLAYVGQNVSTYGVVFFLPLIVKGLGVSTDWIGLTAALPYLCAFVVMIAWGYHSDITGERTWHLAGAYLLCSAGLAACIFIGVGHPVVLMVAICIAVMAQSSTAAPFWSLPSSMLTGAAAAGGIAMIGAVGNLGGWLGPFVFGMIKDASSDTVALLFLASATVMSAICVIAVGQDRRLERIPPRA